MKIRRELFSDIEKQKNAIHLVLIGTKPDIIKQAPLIKTLRQRGHFTVVIHSGQHTQFNLSKGLEEEFQINPDVNLAVSGSLYEQQSQIIQRLGGFLKELKSRKKEIIPYICADTTTAVGAGIASFANLLSTVHVEAGLRTLSPSDSIVLSLLEKHASLSWYFAELKKKSNWGKGSYEPYPEQFDTRAAGPSAGIHFAPTSLNAKHLLSEGYAKERVFVVGNTISDALSLVEKNVEKSNIFTLYPVLQRPFIRFCIHRRENIASKQRFMAIYEAMEALLEEGNTVLFISLPTTELALKTYRLKERTMALRRRYKHFVYSDVLPYYTDTIALMKRCQLVVTDSGSIQEETNLLGIPGVVVRFNTDRPEAVFAGSNVLAPPITKEIVLRIVKSVLEDKKLQQQMKKTKKLYGRAVSQRIVQVVERSVERNSSFNLFEFMEHERLGLSKRRFWRKETISW